jgi:hypothetical protein
MMLSVLWALLAFIVSPFRSRVSTRPIACSGHTSLDSGRAGTQLWRSSNHRRFSEEKRLEQHAEAVSRRRDNSHALQAIPADAPPFAWVFSKLDTQSPFRDPLVCSAV